MTDEQDVRASRRVVGRPAALVDKFALCFIGMVIVAGIYVFATLFVPDFTRRFMQQDLVDGAGVLASARIVTVAETGRWYAKKPILHFSVEVAPQGAAAFMTQFDQEVSLLQLAALRPNAQVWVRYSPDEPDHVVLVNAP